MPEVADMLCEQMAVERAKALRADAEAARRVRTVVSVRRAERRMRRARARLRVAKLRLARVV